MGLHPQLGAMTERHKKRLFFIKELGCVACRLRFGTAGPGGDGHHAEDASGRPIGHDALICLCPWHHVAKPPGGYRSHGPSRHFHTVEFTQVFGTDLELLEFQNQLLEKHLASFIIRPL